MGQQGPPGAKEKAFFKNDFGPHGMPKQVFLARFELIVARCGPPKIPLPLENGVFWDKKLVRFGSKMCFSTTNPRPLGVPQQVE